jgi:predicted protein tyrosine phosphatase
VAEEVFRVLTWGAPGRKGYEARSAGIDPSPGGRLLARRDVAWADLICVMEASHEEFIRARWPAQSKKIRVLGIPDVYMPDDPDLRELLAGQVRKLLAD